MNDHPEFLDRGQGYQTSLTHGGLNPLHDILANAAPQAALVIEYLASGRGLSGLIAHTVLGVTSLTTRIAELRKLGLPITGKWHSDHNNKRFMVYRYEPGEEAKDEPLNLKAGTDDWESEGGPSHPRHGEPHRQFSGHSDDFD